MESLVTWFTTHLGMYISPKAVIFIISLMPILELRGGLLGCQPFEDTGNRSHPHQYYWKYSSHSVYSFVYQTYF